MGGLVRLLAAVSRNLKEEELIFEYVNLPNKKFGAYS